MTETIQPFYRVSEEPASGWPRWIVRLMRFHFGLAGLLLFFGAVGLFIYLYTLKFERLDLGWSLRIKHPGDLFEQNIQLQLAGAVVLGVLSLIPFQAIKLLGQGRQGALGFARLSALMLMVGYPVGAVLIWMVSREPDAAEDSGLVQDMIQQAAWGVRIVAALLFLQATFALGYFIASFTGALRALTREPGRGSGLVGLRRVVIGLWAVVLIGLGAVLGVLTDWLYELPVQRPHPGDLLYATSFDDFNDEWDIYPGRDSAQIVTDSADPAGASLTGGRLVIKHGSPVADEVVWSTLDRKFNDVDLRVTTLLVDGPFDQNQYGIIFRYRDEQNFYLFRISSDGYYSLAKVKNGVQEMVSDWNTSGTIRQGNAANEIRVWGQQTKFRFFINGEPVALCLKGNNKTSMWVGPDACVEGGELTYVYEDKSFKQGRVALAAGTIDGSEITVAFDDLVIVGPSPEAG